MSLDAFFHKKTRGWAPFSPIPNGWGDVAACVAPPWVVGPPAFAKMWPWHLNRWDLCAPKDVSGCIFVQGFWICLFSKAHFRPEKSHGPLGGPFEAPKGAKCTPKMRCNFSAFEGGASKTNMNEIAMEFCIGLTCCNALDCSRFSKLLAQWAGPHHQFGTPPPKSSGGG